MYCKNLCSKLLNLNKCQKNPSIFRGTRVSFISCLLKPAGNRLRNRTADSGQKP